MNKFFQVSKRLAVGAVAAGAAVAANAQAAPSIDTASVVATINGGLVAIGAIGLAVLGVYGTIAIYNWIKRPIK
jgi:hypothetical protein